MGNGSNEPIQFTRADAERLKTIEIRHDQSHAKLDTLITKIDRFLSVHVTNHIDLDKRVASNTRFRRNIIKVTLWVFSTSTGLGLLAAGAKAAGWLP